MSYTPRRLLLSEGVLYLFYPIIYIFDIYSLLTSFSFEAK